jgi:hypothetical protein
MTGLKPTVAKRAARGLPISTKNVAKAIKALSAVDGTEQTCALDGCDEPVIQPGAKFCAGGRCRKIHGRRTYRLGKKAKAAEGPFPVGPGTPRRPEVFDDQVVCPLCGFILGGRDALRGVCDECEQVPA